MNGRFVLVLSSVSAAVLFLFLVVLFPDQELSIKQGNNTFSTHNRKLLHGTAVKEPDRIRGERCSKADIVINQGATSPLPSGIPTYTVEIMNVCVSGCDISGIHFSCGWFSSARLINPNTFRRLRYNDCLVNDGKPLMKGGTLSFQYANTFLYPLSVSRVWPLPDTATSNLAAQGRESLLRKDMNNLSLNGLRKLPPGFRFQPTDEELVFQYLKCKVFSYPLPASIIPDLNVCNFDPWDLPGGTEDERTDWIMHEYRLVTISNKDFDSLHANNPLIQNYLNHEMEKWVLCHVFLKKTSRNSSDEEENMQSFCNNNNNNEKVKKPKTLVHKIKPKLYDFMRENDDMAAESSSSSSSSWSSNITEISSSACSSRQY
ncbi:hypothetical protein GQ457_04G036010 [Hibiscus cannabinus]